MFCDGWEEVGSFWGCTTYVLHCYLLDGVTIQPSASLKPKAREDKTSFVITFTDKHVGGNTHGAVSTILMEMCN